MIQQAAQTLVVDSGRSLFDTGRGRFFSSTAIPGGSGSNHGQTMYRPRANFWVRNFDLQPHDPNFHFLADNL